MSMFDDLPEDETGGSWSGLAKPKVEQKKIAVLPPHLASRRRAGNAVKPQAQTQSVKKRKVVVQQAVPSSSTAGSDDSLIFLIKDDIDGVYDPLEPNDYQEWIAKQASTLFGAGVEQPHGVKGVDKVKNMMANMGYIDGEGLGKHNDGMREPLDPRKLARRSNY